MDYFAGGMNVLLKQKGLGNEEGLFIPLEIKEGTRGQFTCDIEGTRDLLKNPVMLSRKGLEEMKKMMFNG